MPETASINYRNKERRQITVYQRVSISCNVAYNPSATSLFYVHEKDILYYIVKLSWRFDFFSGKPQTLSVTCNRRENRTNPIRAMTRKQCP